MTSVMLSIAELGRDVRESTRDASVNSALLAQILASVPEGVQQTLVHTPNRSPKWRSLREEYLKINNVCEACGGTDNLEVHHIRPFHLFPHLELDDGNLLTLCSEGPGNMNCHLIIGHCGRWIDYSKKPQYAAQLFKRIIGERSH